MATNGNDFITGTVFNDYIAALAGNDRVIGLAGDDTIHGQTGNDSLYGQDGNDYITGGGGFDFIGGGHGDDVLIGSSGPTRFSAMAVMTRSIQPDSANITVVSALTISMPAQLRRKRWMAAPISTGWIPPHITATIASTCSAV